MFFNIINNVAPSISVDKPLYKVINPLLHSHMGVHTHTHPSWGSYVFLNLVTGDIQSWEHFVMRGVLCTVTDLAAPLALMHWLPVAFLPQLWHCNISLHLSMSPGAWLPPGENPWGIIMDVQTLSRMGCHVSTPFHTWSLKHTTPPRRGQCPLPPYPSTSYMTLCPGKHLFPSP